MVLWSIVGLSLVLALTACVWARRVARKLEALTHSYWELRYDYTRLRSQVARLDPEQPEIAVPVPTPQQASVSFVPLSAIRKTDRGPESPRETGLGAVTRGDDAERGPGGPREAGWGVGAPSPDKEH